ncbi:MAG: oligosaccharide flippase family protein, partial [Deltaproteobacteria bacterium]
MRRLWDRIKASSFGYRLAHGTFWSMMGAGASQSLMLLTSIISARILGKQQFGEFGIINNTIGMFGVFAGFALGMTATKYVAEFRRKDPAKAGRIVALSSLVAMGTGAAVALVLLVIAPWLASKTLAAPQLTTLLRISAGFLFFGMNAWGFHLINVLIHILNSWLVFVCARRLRLAYAWALFAAAVFLVHPVQTEAVACVSGISNLAVTLFMLLALWVYLCARARGRVFVGGALGLCVAAFFTKEQAVLFAGVLLLYEFLYRRETSWTKFKSLGPFFLATAGFLVWRAWLFPGFAAGIWS